MDKTFFDEAFVLGKTWPLLPESCCETTFGVIRNVIGASLVTGSYACRSHSIFLRNETGVAAWPTTETLETKEQNYEFVHYSFFSSV